MIWDPHKDLESDQSVIVSYIMDEIGAVCGKGVFVSRDNLEQVARAVETFLEQDVKASAVDSKYLVMLASRALSSVAFDDAQLCLDHFLVRGETMSAPQAYPSPAYDRVILGATAVNDLILRM
jgi:hypothetical protein